MNDHTRRLGLRSHSGAVAPFVGKQTGNSGRHGLAWNLTLAMFVILFVGDLLSGIGLVPQIAPDLALLAVQFALLLYAIAQTTRYRTALRVPGLKPVAVLLGVVLVSALLNGQGIAEIIVFVRAMIGQYIVLIVMVNLGLSDWELKKLNRLIFALCAIQIPVAFYRMLTSGNDVFLAGGTRSFGTEAATGTLARAGGSLGVTFPLIVIGFLLAFYLWKPKKTYLAWMLGFVFFSYCTGKRAFAFVLPLYIVALYWLIGRGVFISKKVIILGLIGVFAFIGGLSLHPSLNPSGKIGGKIDIVYAVKKAIDYETGVTWEAKTAGRYTTSKHLIELALDDGLLIFLFGSGPSTMMKSGLIDSNFYNKLSMIDVSYGITGAGWIFSQIGLLGLLFFLGLLTFFFRRTLRIRKTLRDPYWHAVCGGLIAFHLVIFYDTIAYSTTCVSGKLLPALYWFFLAQVLLRNKATKYQITPNAVQRTF